MAPGVRRDSGVKVKGHDVETNENEQNMCLGTNHKLLPVHK